LRDGLSAAGLAAKVIYSGGVDVDILAQVRSKREAKRIDAARIRRVKAGQFACHLCSAARCAACFVAAVHVTCAVWRGILPALPHS
jgi:hypothetical protein